MPLWKIGSHCKTCLSGHLIRKMRELGLYIPTPVSNWLDVAFRKYLFLGNSGLQYAQSRSRGQRNFSFENRYRSWKLTFLGCPKIVRPEWIWLQCRHHFLQRGNKSGSCQYLDSIKCHETGLDL